MPSIPLKTISSLLESAHNHPREWVCKGRAYKAYYNGKVTMLNHYGTDILKVDRTMRGVWLGRGAYSKSDVDAINSVFYIYGVDLHARIQKGEIVMESVGDRFKYLGAIAKKVRL